MPYGMPGGDTKKNDAWMEKCVDSVMKSGKDKSSAIAICKVTYMKSHGKAEDEEALSDTSLRDVENEISRALQELFPHNPQLEAVPSTGVYLVDVYATYVIAEIGDALYKLDYSLDNGQVSFSNPVKVVRKIVYEPEASETQSEVKKYPKDGGRITTYHGISS